MSGSQKPSWPKRLFPPSPDQPFLDMTKMSIPRYAAGVYTIWDEKTFIYVGKAGKKGAEQLIREKREAEENPKKKQPKPWGLMDRLGRHANGKRSGNQFCVYVADRFILDALNETDIRAITKGVDDNLIDKRVRKYVRDRFRFRFWKCSDADDPADIEKIIRFGKCASLRDEYGLPLLNR